MRVGTALKADVSADPECGLDTSVQLDLTGLKCPLPALRVRRALRNLPAGSRLVVICTDPLSGIDVPSAAREEGALVETTERRGDTFRFRLHRT